MKKYNEIFAKSKTELGRTMITKHRIDTGEEKPIKLTAYRAGPKQREIIRKEVEKMLEQGAIRPSDSNWASPVVLVEKKNGDIRFCTDFRKLNGITKKDNHPLPRIDDMLESFYGSEWFSSIDLASGYWQIEIEEQDKGKTAFITFEGLYEYNVMPFGLCNAPATFQRLMHKVLGELIYKEAPVYLDDINIHTKTFKEHMINLRKVFEKMRKAGLKLRKEKCEFCKRELEFLGHLISGKGIKMNPDKVQIIKEIPRPKTVQEIQSFLGAIGYYRKFIKEFAKIAKPLSDLTKGATRKGQNKKNIEDLWTDKHEKRFQELKRRMIKEPILRYPDFDKQFIISTDASKYAIGAILKQKDDENREYVISYNGRKLKEAEVNYTVTEKECLAIVWALEKYHHYIWRTKCIIEIITDHKPLIWLRKQEPKNRLGRWIMKLEGYDFEIKYKEGKKHIDADFLSRKIYENE